MLAGLHNFSKLFGTTKTSILLANLYIFMTDLYTFTLGI